MAPDMGQLVHWAVRVPEPVATMLQKEGTTRASPRKKSEPKTIVLWGDRRRIPSGDEV